MSALQRTVALAVGATLVVGPFSAIAQRPSSAPAAAARPIADASGALSPDTAVWKGLEWRNIGPSNMSGRVADVEGVPGNANIVYIGSASGGAWKTTNAGVTWKPIFDKQPVASIGDIALEPGNPDVIYVGTGEGKPRNSASFGNGVYKSTDGGMTWRHLGLTSSERIPRMLVNPRTPNVVYAGVLGHVFGASTERGVFMSTNGGEAWEKVLYIDDRHGVSDMDLHPSNPNVLYAGMWHFERRPWTHRSGGEQGGVFRSVDGGRTWKKLTNGLPKLMGRIGVQVAPSNPDVVYVLAETNEGTLFRSDDKGETFTVVNRDVNIVNRGFYFTRLRVDPTDANRVYAISGSLHVSIDGGKTFRMSSSNTHGDYHSLWIDPENPSRVWQGQDGGTAVSYDRAETWETIRNFPLAQFYALYVDNREIFYNVGGGLQDNGTWSGPSRSRDPGGIANDDWRSMSFGDGFQIVVHPDDPDLFLSELQGGGIFLTNQRTREQIDASPQPRRNDGGPVRDLKFRFNWNSPIIQSPHDGKIVYFAGNAVFKTTDFAASGWEQISPDLSTNDSTKLGHPGGPVWKENTTAEYHGTVISFAESPAQAGVLWAGTDDGNLQLSRDGGKAWTNLTPNGPPVPRFSPVSHVEPSRTAAGTAYVSYDRHMFDDFRGHIFKTTDFGSTWTDVSANLPNGAHVWVVREDPKNTNLIYAGTELGLFVSYTGGGNWHRLTLKNMPVVSVHDVIVHPRANDLIVGTHGRGLWMFDDATPIQSWDAATKAKRAHLFPIRAAHRFTTRGERYGWGHKPFQGPNPAYGALITYYVATKSDSAVTVKLEVLDGTGKVVREIKKAPRAAGMNRINWDLAYDAPRLRRDSVGPGEESFFAGQIRGPLAVPGRYVVRLTIGSETLEQPIEVKADPESRTTVADLQRQFEQAMKLRDMRSVMHDTLRAVDAARTQLVGRKNVVATQRADNKEQLIRTIDAEIAQLDSLLNRLTIPQGRPFWSEGPRITERLGALFSGVDAVNRAPTKYQVELLGELEVELRAALEEVRKALARTVTMR